MNRAFNNQNFSTPKVSIIIPIYNVGKYLNRCLDSIVNQTLTEIEIICVNDGSTDNSLEIIKEYAFKDNRIKIINKTNTGYGDSVNKGISLATGEFIGIVESDDYANTDMYKTLYSLAIKYNVEVVKSSFNLFWSKPKPKYMYYSILPDNFYNIVLNPRDNLEVFDVAPSVWSAIYKRDFLQKNKINFLATPGASYQDVSFSFKVWMFAQEVFFTEKAFINYFRDNQQSSIRSREKIFCICDEFEEINCFLKKYKRNDLFKAYYKNLLCSYLRNISRLPHKSRKIFIKKTMPDFYEIKKYIEEGFFTVDKDSYKRLNLLIKNVKLFLIKYFIGDFKEIFYDFFVGKK